MPITVAVPPLRSMLNACSRGRRQPDRLERVVDAAAGELEHGTDRDRRRTRRRRRSRRTSARGRSFDATRSTAMTRPAPTIAAAWIALSPMPPQPITATVVAGAHLRGVHHRADAGGDAAADERGLVERHVGPDLHEQVLVHEQLLGEARQVGELVDGLVAAPQPRRAGRDRRASPTLSHRFGRPGEAVAARAAEAADARDHVVAGLHVASPREPTASTMPADSCPSTAGTGHGYLPSMKCRSEWTQGRPRVVRTSTSCGPTVPICTSSMTNRRSTEF